MGGMAPYTYSINNGATYQSSNIFNGLCSNTYTVVTKDSLNNTQTKIVTVGYNSTPVTYTIGTVLVGTSFNGLINQVGATWKVNINPPLPVGTSITFQLNVSDTEYYEGPGNGVISSVINVYKNGVNQSSPIPVTTSQNIPRPNCSPYTTDIINNTRTYTFTMTNGDTVTGDFTSTLEMNGTQVVGANGCTTELIEDVVASTASPVINGCTCCTVVNNPQVQGIIGHTLSGGGSPV
jgi:hypothetical protein